MKSLLFLLLIFTHLALAPLAADTLELPKEIQIIHESQNFLAAAQPIQAQAVLLKLETDQPEIRKNPLFCYQRFFVALEGLGERPAADLMLKRLDHLVATGSLSATSPIYRSVTQAWNRALFFTDSELPRLAHIKMQTRLAMNPKP